ncbi:MAG: enoyl-CoA hydratase-related protein [Lachnospiraceae bacterium]
MDLKNVIYEKDGAIATIKLNRPKQLNALSTEVLLDVEAALNEVEADDEVRVVIVTGEGRAFAAGADIAAMKDYDQLAGFDYCATGHKVYRHMEKINKPFIAAVNGYALGGGCEMTLACDLRIASSKAVFGLPETSLGIIPGYGGTQRLPRTIGVAKAKELIYTASNIKADKALEYGLVSKVVEPEALMDEARALAEKILKNAPVAVSLAKYAINNGIDMDIDRALNFENVVESTLFSTADKTEGMTAFVEKRDHKYIGH